VSRIAIGDVQGCHAELQKLVERAGFSADRDRLWFTGDLVNRGPASLETLRYVRSLGDNAITVLGNHDLHLLALAFGAKRKVKSGDTIEDVLGARDRDALLEWLITRPLAHYDETSGDLLVHAGLVPQWSVQQTLALARAVEAALRSDPESLFENMYGDKPDKWSDSLAGMDRLRFSINVLTRLRVCTPDGRIDLKMKGPLDEVRAPYRAWFAHENRRTRDTRVIFGHWSALGLVQQNNVIGLDTGCVWGGALTAINLDSDEKPMSLSCRSYQSLDG
jgi:bis(5'-nucleosyl)-tetraphosphatase (symmetrical)